MRPGSPNPRVPIAVTIALLALICLIIGLQFFRQDQSSSASPTGAIESSASLAASAPNLYKESRRSPSSQSSGVATGPLRVLSSNPRYFSDASGKAVYLAGAHTWSNGMEDRGTIDPPPKFDFDEYLNFMNAHNFNWMRLWTSEMSRANPSDDPAQTIIAPPFKWLRSGPGRANDGAPKYDFTKFDQRYFDRMRARISQSGREGIYVSVMLFNGYMWQFDEFPHDGNPFEPRNNVNAVDCAGLCPSDASQLPANAWQYEQAYIRKVIDTVNDLPNVMYEVSNEAGAPYSDSWQTRVLAFVKEYESKKPFQHPVGFTCQFTGGIDATLYESRADWISPCSPLPADATGQKVIINDTDHSFGWHAMRGATRSGQMEWAWENFARGNNLAFMDPYLVRWEGRNACTGATRDPAVCTKLDPYWKVVRDTLTDIRSYAAKIDLAKMTPQSSLSTSSFCLADPGSQYLVFSTTGAFKLATAAGTYTYEWFDPLAREVVRTGTVTTGSEQDFAAPFTGDAVLWLHK